MLNSTVIGVWLWGSATAVLGIAVIAIVLIGRPTGVYTRIKDASTAIGGVIAASALAWSLFYQEDAQTARAARLEQLLERAEVILERTEAKAAKTSGPVPASPIAVAE